MAGGQTHGVEVAVSGWEAGVLAVGRAVVHRAAASWLARRDSARQRSSELSELIGSASSDWFKRRTLERQMEEIADGVAQRLAPLCRHEFRGLDDHEQAAA